MSKPRPPLTCGHPDRRYGGRGLCTTCYQSWRSKQWTAQGTRRRATGARRGRRALSILTDIPERYPDWQCRQCGTTIRPAHSAGLCVDCVRAAGGLAHDPWEAA